MTDRILVIRGGALGDFILGLPALAALRHAFPRAMIEVIAPAAVLPLASHLADTTIPLERGDVASLFSDADLVPPEIADRYRELDLAVIWLSDADGTVRRAVQRLKPRLILWAPALPSRPGIHAADHLIETLRPLGIELERCWDLWWHAGTPGSPLFQPVIGRQGTGEESGRAQAALVRPAASARSKAADALRRLGLPPGIPLVAIHPGSGGAWKNWPPDRFAQVADELAARGLGVLVIQGPADTESIRRMMASVADASPRVVSGLSVEELGGILTLCSCYLGNDSGVTHLAAAVGTPTIAVFGPTDPVVWGPRGPRVTVLRVRQECSPCSRETAATCRHRSCLQAVGVKQVVEAVDRIL